MVGIWLQFLLCLAAIATAGAPPGYSDGLGGGRFGLLQPMLVACSAWVRQFDDE